MPLRDVSRRYVKRQAAVHEETGKVIKELALPAIAIVVLVALLMSGVSLIGAGTVVLTFSAMFLLDSLILHKLPLRIRAAVWMTYIGTMLLVFGFMKAGIVTSTTFGLAVPAGMVCDFDLATASVIGLVAALVVAAILYLATRRK